LLVTPEQLQNEKFQKTTIFSNFNDQNDGILKTSKNDPKMKKNAIQEMKKLPKKPQNRENFGISKNFVKTDKK
jgi:hypothetical protein